MNMFKVNQSIFNYSKNILKQYAFIKEAFGLYVFINIGILFINVKLKI